MKTVETMKPIRFEAFSFGSIHIDGVTYERDVLIDRGQVRKRKKKPSKKFRDDFGHTPLSVEEKIPWKCRRLTADCSRLSLDDLIRSRQDVRGNRYTDLVRGYQVDDE